MCASCKSQFTREIKWNQTTKITKNTKLMIEFMTLWFLHELRDLRGETSFFRLCKEIIYKRLICMWLSFTKPQSDRCLVKPCPCANLIHQISVIGKMNPFRIVSKANERRRFIGHLCRVIDFEPPASEQRRLIAFHGVLENFI